MYSSIDCMYLSCSLSAYTDGGNPLEMINLKLKQKRLALKKKWPVDFANRQIGGWGACVCVCLGVCVCGKGGITM